MNHTLAESLRPEIRRWVLVFLGLLLMRGLLLLQGAVPVYLPGLMVVADAAAAAILVLARRLLLPRRIWIALYAPLVALIYLAAGMHAELHGSFFRLAHILQALDGDFLAATLSWRSLTWFPLYLLVAAGLLWVLAVPMPTPPRRVRAVVATGLLLLAYFALMPGLTHLTGNPLLSSVVQIPGAFWRTGEREAEPVLAVADAQTDPVFFLRDQTGAMRVGRPNVLLILVEGLSGAYLPSVAAHHGVAPDLEVPGLDLLIHRHGFHLFPNAIAMQRQTHRGSYPILCGDYPRVTTGVPKMTLIANSGQPITCLPRVLKEAGYQTAYLQAASLRFMRKDVFMPLTGFDTVMGRDEFAGLDDSAGGWGPEDGPFFLAALQRLKALEAADTPWFATLLNVATHHPFVHADEDPGEALRVRRQRSFERLSTALDALMAGLARAGMLDDAVVILTSDEAGGYHDPHSSTGLLHNNFGFMAVRMPDRGVWPPLAPADTLVAHMDVAVTVMDLLGLDAVSNMIGSSMLHNPHRRPRGLLFGDTYGARTFFLYDLGELVACDETLLRCDAWHFDPKRLFGSLRLLETPPRLPVSARNRIVGEASLVRDKGAVTEDGTREAPTIITRRRPYLGKQALALADDDLLEVTVEAQALPDDERSARDGTLSVMLRNRDTGASLAERSIIVQGGHPLVTKLQLPTAGTAVTVDVDLHWQPGNPRDEVAIRALDLRRRPAASALLSSPTADP